MIKKIQISNFTSIKSQVLPDESSNLLELPDGLFIIRGPNSTGKTNLVKAILWVIWGGIKGKNQCGIIDESNDRIIRMIGNESSNANKCSINFDFEINNQRYNILRTKTRGNTTKVVLNRIEEDSLIDPLTGFDKTCDKLKEIFNCSSKDIINTFYVRQGEVDYLATRTPTELRTHFEMLFKLKEFTNEIKESLNKKIKESSSEVKKLENEKNEIIQQQQKLDYIKNQKLEDENKLKNISLKFDKIEKSLNTYPNLNDIKFYKETLEKNEKIEIKLENLEYVLDIRKKEIQDNQTDIEEKNKEIKEILTKINENEKLIKSFPKLSVIRTLNDEAQSINILSKSFKNNLIELRKDLQKDLKIEKIEKLDLIIKQIKEEKIKDEKNKEILENNFKTLEKEKLIIIEKTSKLDALIDDLEQKIKLLSEKNECPTCLTPFQHEKHKVQVLNRIKMTIENYKNESEELENLKKNFDKDIAQAEKSLNENENKLKLSNDFLSKFDIISKSNKEIKQKKQIFNQLLAQLEVKTLDDFLSRFEISNLDELLIKIEKVQQKKQHLTDNLNKIKKEIENIEIKSIESRKKVDELNKQIKELNKLKIEIEKRLNNLNLKLNIEELKSFLKNYDVESLSELSEKIIIQKNERDNLNKNIQELKENLDKLLKSINDIEDNVKKLDQIKYEISEKEKIINHLDIIRMQYLDKFISQEVIQNKLFQSIKQEVSNYLLKFSDGQYSFKEIKIARQKGIEFELHDNFDNIDKTMDLLSGGDKAIFGLALRIGLSNLMARIRPFKTSETKPINFNILILDEPLSNIDEVRRRMVIKHLKEDKSFTQIFLITHTPETDDEKFNHKIFVSKTREQGSKYKLFPSILIKNE
ncbi:MAG: SMC family ATPase [Candidatus Lokiarchaeota archaeon]|nr:SMC family ATPase [Candidatus Lokiarchaeota archaeon]